MVFPSPMSPSVPKFSFKTTFSEQSNPDKPLYRFFNDPQHARDFLQGKVWISTFSKCREYENAAQGDAHEGSIKYAVPGTIRGSGSDPAFVEMARRLNFIVPPDAVNMCFSNISSSTVLHDALVICTTAVYNPEQLAKDFGKFCVRIDDPAAFFKRLTFELGSRYALDEFGMDEIYYRDRYFEYLDKLPCGYAFLKPKQYEYQNEIRMVWTLPHDVSLTPGLIDIPELAKFCSPITET